MIGHKFGTLTVTKALGMNHQRQPRYVCVCDCGNIAIVLGADLKSGNQRSCGCVAKNNNDNVEDRIQSQREKEASGIAGIVGSG